MPAHCNPDLFDFAPVEDRSVVAAFDGGAMAYVLLCALRRIGLAHTRFARASCGSIRLKLLKIAALVRISVRRIKRDGLGLSLHGRPRPIIRRRSVSGSPRAEAQHQTVHPPKRGR